MSEGKWVMEQAPWVGDWRGVHGGDEFCDIGQLAVEILAPPLQHDGQGPLFAYLWRRFGYPRNGWDGDKDLVWYALTTTDPEVLLLIIPRQTLDLSFGYARSERLWRACQARYAEELTAVFTPPSKGEYQELEAVLAQSPEGQRLRAVLEAALHDLQRPVYVRDVPIGPLGTLPDHGPWTRLPEASSAALAGWGIGTYDPRAALAGQPHPTVE